MAKTAFIATGRRKKSVARVRLVPGTGAITINRRDVEEYFGLETLKMIVRAPMTLTNTLEKYDVLVNVYGGAAAPPARPAPSVTASPAPCAWPSRTFGPSSRRPDS